MARNGRPRAARSQPLTRVVLAVAALLLAGCASTATESAGTATTVAAAQSRASSPDTTLATASTVRAGATPTTYAPSAGDAGAARTQLAILQVNDAPHSLSGYSRALFPQWLDVDGYGCDARQEVVIEASVTPPAVNDCKVISGRWVSAYDGVTTTNPSTFDVDHVVPLANAYMSGAWAWPTNERSLYANLPFDLWLVSATSNRAKGDESPDQWRPPSHAVWCQYAERWIAIKARWKLTITTAERDALGQMLDTCTNSPGTPIPSTTAPPPTPSTTAAGGSSVYYPNCTAARAAGAAPIYRGQPGYRLGLDRDGDGVACE
jgi:hypothetical protein